MIQIGMRIFIGAIKRKEWPLTVGHLLAMLVVILPFSLLVVLVQWQRQIQIGASADAPPWRVGNPPPQGSSLESDRRY
jgi:hypothetical protein